MHNSDVLTKVGALFVIVMVQLSFWIVPRWQTRLVVINIINNIFDIRIPRFKTSEQS